MKKKVIAFAVVSLFSMGMPVFAAEHGAQHKSEQCQKECEMLLRNCSQEVSSIQDRINKLQAAIKEKGATEYTVEELKRLDQKLKEANETLRILQQP